jgi:phosphomannomutase
MKLLHEKVGPHFYNRHDIHFKPEERAAIQQRLEGRDVKELAGLTVASSDRIDGRRFVFANGAWSIVRFSGTEPLLRVYAEAGSPQDVEKLLHAMEDLLGVEPPKR